MCDVLCILRIVALAIPFFLRFRMRRSPRARAKDTAESREMPVTPLTINSRPMLPPVTHVSHPSEHGSNPDGSPREHGSEHFVEVPSGVSSCDATLPGQPNPLGNA